MRPTDLEQAALGKVVGVSIAVDGQLAKAEETLRRVWGYETFRPLQQAAVAAALSGYDSLVVLPTGGGKSLCFQVPALCLDGLAVVVSPLISLMKDQVDALTACGVSAAFINSSQSAQEQREITQRVRSGQLKLLYLAPERLLSDRMLEFLGQSRVSLFAIDEAHCISDWGHDFRPEYRGLRILKDRFPQVPVHAFTATAAEQVRLDIVKQLGLSRAKVLVGSFDRPNLVYRMLPVDGRLQQVVDVITRHRDESGIVYCISRKEVERVAGALNELGIKAVPYHAGMDEEARKQNQEAFIRDRANVVVATVAFGMGIDKPDVRFVVHAGMPKSIEHYQQESGRAGRDGLESECILLYSGADVAAWRRMLTPLDSQVQSGALRALSAIHNLCTSAVCRHRSLSAYFGQELACENCGACDVCLGELDQVDDPVTLGQKILSCVLRLQQRFGADHTAKVLIGSGDKRILQHESLSTYGLLKEYSLTTVRQWIEQLLSQNFLSCEGEYQTLQVTDSGLQLLRREATPILTRPPQRKAAMGRTATDSQSWVGVDRGLFDQLKKVRLALASERKVPAYVILGDATLRELACVRPTGLSSLRLIRGIGEQRLHDYGQTFLSAIDEYCADRALTRDCSARVASERPASSKASTIGASSLAAFEFFRSGATVEDIATKLGRARSTVFGYLCDFLKHEQLTDASAWVSPEMIPQIQAALAASSDGRLRTAFEALEGKVTYEDLRIVAICQSNSLTKSQT